jgi:acetolactate synthase-1/2/3 large subunit
VAKVKLAEYVAQFLAARGVRHAFGVTGGASLHILHAMASTPGIEPIFTHHEQAAAFAADAYARATGGISCAVATSGPGATNLITGIAGCWFDSVPCLFITGNVTTARAKGNSGVRAFGFQEADPVGMVSGITKYAYKLRDAGFIRYHLELAVWYATEGRPGPVLIDIPDDLQRETIDPDHLPSFTPPLVVEPAWRPQRKEPLPQHLDALIAMLAAAERPVLVLGCGVHLSKAENEVLAWACGWGIPMMTSWGGRDLLSATNRLNCGTFGSHGTRAGNFTIQNADLVIAVGARLSTRETGSNLTTWARGAKLAVVDIDEAELGKFARWGRPLDLAIHADAGAFAFAIRPRAVKMPDWRGWLDRIASYYTNYPVVTETMRNEVTVNPYILIEAISAKAPAGASFFVDTGCAVAWSMQALKLEITQRTYHDFNNTAMGWALPAAIGGCLALTNPLPASVVCIVGDGSLMMNLQELATLRRLGLPVKIILIDNDGYSMVQQTEEQWLGGAHVGTTGPSLGFPVWSDLAAAFDIPFQSIFLNSDIDSGLAWLFHETGPAMLRVRIDSGKRVIPQVAFGRPIEDGEPYLPRDEFARNMITPPLPISLEQT